MNRPMSRAASAGFTLIELVVTLSILSILVRLSLPQLERMRREAVAAQAVADMSAARTAAFASFDANGRWPASSSDGTVPAEMAAFLPANATFTRAHYRLAWENDTLGGASGTPAGTLVGVTVVTDDEILRNTLIATFGRTTPNFEAGDRLTFVFVSTLEAN